MGACKEILNITSARPGLSWGGFSLAHASYILHAIAPPLVGPPVARRRHFCAHVQQSGTSPKKKNRCKEHLQALHGIFSSSSVPIFSRHKTPYRGPRSATQGIKQPRPTPSGASRGIVICSGPGRGRRNSFCQRPTRRRSRLCIGWPPTRRRPARRKRPEPPHGPNPLTGIVAGLPEFHP